MKGQAFSRCNDRRDKALKFPTQRNAAAQVEDFVIEDTLVGLVGDIGANRAEDEPIADAVRGVVTRPDASVAAGEPA